MLCWASDATGVQVLCGRLCSLKLRRLHFESRPQRTKVAIKVKHTFTLHVNLLIHTNTTSEKHSDEHTHNTHTHTHTSHKQHSTHLKQPLALVLGHRPRQNL